MLAGDTDYIHQHPIATKRVMRAILKATDFCATEPKVVAQRVVNDKITDRYDYALQTLADVPYGKWREYNPEDTIRFYALAFANGHGCGSRRESSQRRTGDC
jgi:NitT/TauT family transport system substrate-binding protein